MRQAFEREGDELALRQRQAAHDACEALAALLQACRVLGSAARIGQVRLHFVARRIAAGLQRVIDGAVVRDAQHEGLQRRLAAEARQALPDREQDFLAELVAARGIGLECRGDARDRRAVLGDDAVEGRPQRRAGIGLRR